MTKERLDLIDPVGRRQCSEQIGLFLSQLHNFDLAVARECQVRVANYPAEFSDLLSRARTSLFPALDQTDQQFVTRILTSIGIENFRPAFLHGDLSPDHILCEAETGPVAGIIDFGDMAIGDPAWDLAYIYRDYGPAFLIDLLQTYQSDDRQSLLRRMFQFYVFAAVDWAVDSVADSDNKRQEAIRQLRTIRMTEEYRQSELLAAGLEP